MARARRLKPSRATQSSGTARPAVLSRRAELSSARRATAFRK